MMYILRLVQKTLSAISLIILAMLSTMLVADDTEIYFSGAGVSQVKPNVLFVLDTSFSMQSLVDTNGNGVTKIDHDSDPNTKKINDPGDISRIETLHDAMENLLTGLDNVNVGIMRMNGAESPTKRGTSLACKNATQLSNNGQTYVSGALDSTNTGNTGKSSAAWGDACYIPTGGAILFPVANLDAASSTVTGEAGGGTFSISVPVAASSDDAEEEDPGAANVDIDNEYLQVATEQCAPSAAITKTYHITQDDDDAGEKGNGTFEINNPFIGKRFTGFRFSAVDVPKNASISVAYLEFTADGPDSGDVNVEIAGDMSNSNAPAKYTSSNGPKDRNATKSTARVDWVGIPQTSNNQVFQSPDITEIVQEIVNDANWNPATTQPMAFLIDRDDKAGDNTRNGRDTFDYSKNTSKSADLVVEYCAPTQDKSRVGVRFQDVRVPQGATITSATISMTAATTGFNVGVTTEKLYIDAEDADNPVTYGQTTAGQMSNRTYTAGTYTNGIEWTGAQMAAIDSSNPLWLQDDSYTTPELKTIVQKVVDRSGWCGGNSMAFKFEGDSAVANNLTRAVYSYDSDPGSAPILNITYDTSGISGADTGCSVVDHNIPAAESDHDSTQQTNKTNHPTRSGLFLGNNNEYGVIFSLPIMKSTTVKDAKLQFTMKEASGTADATFYVNAENVSGVADFTSGSDDIGGRTRVVSGNGNNVTAQPTGAIAIDSTITLDVTSLVQAVVNRSDWAIDKQMALFIKKNNGQERRAWSFDGSPIKAPSLLITTQESTTTLTSKTVRDRLLEINETMTKSTLLGWTPSVETLYEAARYWRGKGVDFGKQRGMARITSTGSLTSGSETIDYKTKMHRTLTSHPGSWTGGTYNNGGGADCQFSNDASCVQDYISGSPVYTSPIVGNECAENYTIFLTDGAPTFTNDSTVSKITTEFSEIASCSVDASVNAKESRGRCAVEMADAMLNNDQDGDSSNGDQTVKTYTIAFNLNDAKGNTWLQQIANAGGGTYYTADTADSLLTVFNQIFGDVLKTSTTFATPAITTNFFNRTLSRDEIYFGLFTPALDKRWDGNVKRFRICVDDDNADESGVICSTEQVSESAVLDVMGVEATDASTNQFKGTSRSFWSDVVDGPDTRKGGAGAEITDYTKRVIYTNYDSTGEPVSGTPLSNDNFKLTSANWDSSSSPDLSHMRADICSDTTDLSSGSECENKMLWLLGKDVFDDDEDSSTTDTRWSVGDILHASPTLITYGYIDSVNVDTDGDGTADASNGKLDADEVLIDKLLVNTNDGGVRMINPLTGKEDWMFMPESTVTNVSDLFENGQGRHIYGLDETPVIQQVDSNNDGIIDPFGGDSVKLFQVMRRGGNFMYALDLSPAAKLTSNADQIVPKHLWQIEGGTGDYIRMGETWSRPTMATINVVGAGNKIEEKEVLIIGGGYDTDLDENYATENSNPNLGNAIYIIDPDNGNKLLSISHAEDVGASISASDADIEIPGFHYSITAEISVVDGDGDGTDDRLYFPDTAGNVWRVDLGDDIKSNGSGLFSGVSSNATTRVGRLATLSGSGDSNKRRFYRAATVTKVVDTVFTDSSNADNTDGKLIYVLVGSGYVAHPLTTDVTDRFYALRDKVVNRMNDSNADRVADGTGFSSAITESDLFDATSAVLDETDNSITGARASRGYFYTYETSGEKSLRDIGLLFGQVAFTTYAPESSVSNTCSANLGSSEAYNFFLKNAAGVVDWNLDGNIDINDRKRHLGSGVASNPSPLFTDQGVKLGAGFGQSFLSLTELLGGGVERTYWYEDDN